MKKKLYLMLILFLMIFMISGCDEVAKSESNNNESPEKEITADPVEKILKEMRIEDKIGQMTMIGVYGYEMNNDIKYSLNEYNFGGVILFARNVESKAQLETFVSQLQNEANYKVPLFIAIDEEGGDVSRLRQIEKDIAPSQQAIGDTGDISLARDWALKTATNLKSLGINVNFAPVADVGSPDTRSFSNNAEIVAEFVDSAAKGYEEEDVIYCLKHFPGIGKRITDPHQEISSVDVSRETLEKEDLFPFKSIIANHSPDKFMVMVSHLKYPAIDEKNSATLSYKVMTELLREKLGYDGIIITDDLEMGAIANHNSFSEVGVKAIKAGADILLICHDYQHEQDVYNGVLKAVQNGEISEERINESVRRILKAKLNNLSYSNID